MENSLICVCGHEEENHGLGPCWVCFGLNLTDNEKNVPIQQRHTLCNQFKQDNLRFLEQEYARLSKRVF